MNNRPYIDMVMALGAVGLGYADDRVGEAVRFAVDAGGGVYSLPSILEERAAEAILANVAPWADRIRFVKTGSEATTAGVKMAMLATGRHHVMVRKDAYHGWHPWADIRPKQDVVEYDSEDSDLDEVLAIEHVDKRDVAAVLVEPDRWSPPTTEHLELVQRWCVANGSVLIFDEMIYGYRHTLGGLSMLHNVTPDIATYGKAMGNGIPVACVVGGGEVMEAASAVSGTFGGDVLGLSAAMAVTSAWVDDGAGFKLNNIARYLHNKLKTLEDSYLALLRIDGLPGHQRLVFLQPAEDDGRWNPRRFASEMAIRGVIWHPACVNVSAAHTVEQIDRVVSEARSVISTWADNL